jgi:hypothetical protein
MMDAIFHFLLQTDDTSSCQCGISQSGSMLQLRQHFLMAHEMASRCWMSLRLRYPNPRHHPPLSLLSPPDIFSIMNMLLFPILPTLPFAA